MNSSRIQLVVMLSMAISLFIVVIFPTFTKFMLGFLVGLSLFCAMSVLVGMAIAFVMAFQDYIKKKKHENVKRGSGPDIRESEESKPSPQFD